MAITRAIAISAESRPDYSGEILRISEADCFRMLAVALGIETETLSLKLRGYSIREVEVIPGVLIKAEFTHVRYDIKTRTDVIRTDLVNLVWEPSEDGKGWKQLGCIRREIENRTHYKTDAGFENAATDILAANIEMRLTEPESGISNAGRVGYVRGLSNTSAYEVNAGEKSPASVQSQGFEKTPASKKSRKISKPRHGRGRR
jgi:hypothetical protein